MNDNHFKGEREELGTMFYASTLPTKHLQGIVIKSDLRLAVNMYCKHQTTTNKKRIIVILRRENKNIKILTSNQKWQKKSEIKKKNKGNK